MQPKSEPLYNAQLSSAACGQKNSTSCFRVYFNVLLDAAIRDDGRYPYGQYGCNFLKFHIITIADCILDAACFTLPPLHL